MSRITSTKPTITMDGDQCEITIIDGDLCEVTMNCNVYVMKYKESLYKLNR